MAPVKTMNRQNTSVQSKHAIGYESLNTICVYKCNFFEQLLQGTFRVTSNGSNGGLTLIVVLRRRLANAVRRLGGETSNRLEAAAVDHHLRRYVALRPRCDRSNRQTHTVAASMFIPIQYVQLRSTHVNPTYDPKSNRQRFPVLTTPFVLPFPFLSAFPSSRIFCDGTAPWKNPLEPSRSFW